MASSQQGPALSPRFVSSVKNVAIGPVHRLSKAPSSGSRGPCDHLQIEPRTAAGRQILAAGWGVTSEERIGDYQAVSFASDFRPGTSGSCEIADGNAGFFKGGKLVAIAYAPASATATIGSIERHGNALRLWDGGLLAAPMADVALTGDGGIEVRAVAAQDQVCGGRAIVPNLHGQPIGKARAALRTQGWEPVPGPAGRTDAREREYAGRFPEVGGCSGTGFAYCGFDYRHAAGTLTVITAGDNDDPTVARYRVACGG